MLELRVNGQPGIKFALLGPPGAIGEKFTVRQHGHEDVSHEQRPLYRKNNGLCNIGSHVRMVVPPSFATP